MNLQEQIRKVLKEEVNSQDKQKTLSILIDLMGPSNVRDGNRIENADESLIKYESRLTINVDNLDQETLNKINKFMDEHGWFPTNIKSDYETGGKYSLHVRDFIGEKDVIINYESKESGEIKPNQTTAYHVTPNVFLDKILEKGLTPKTESKLSDHPERIYLFLDDQMSTFKSMSRALFNTLSDDKKKLINDYVVLEIDLTQIPNHKFYVDPQASATYRAIFTREPIPASAIKVIDKIPTSDLKPILSPEEDKEIDDLFKKRREDIKKSEADNTNYQNKLDNILNQLGDEDLNVNLDDLMGLQEQISRIKSMM